MMTPSDFVIANRHGDVIIQVGLALLVQPS